jgi:hypothetical protein
MKPRAILVTTLVVAGLPTLPLPAAAYVRTVTEEGAFSHWNAPCVTMEVSLGAPPAVSDSQGYLDAAKAAGATWSQASLDGVDRCSNVIFSVVSVPDVAGPVGMDYHNRLIFRQDKWCRDPPPKEEDPNDPPCYDEHALAITSVFQLKSSGEILDADLEVNAYNFTWGDFVAHPELFQSNTQDFQGTITHEFGHVIGLDHTCFKPGAAFADGKPIPRPTDNLGNPVPDCSDYYELPAVITEATMYASANSPSAEVDLRSLSPDDVQAACEIYPVKTDFVCLPPSGEYLAAGGGGCSYPAGPRRDSTACVLVLLVMATLGRRRR